MKRVSRCFIALWALALLLAGAGCQLPDVKPFADATLELRNATATAGEEAVRSAATGTYLDAQNKPISLDSPNHPARQLEAEWRTRLRAMDALVEYSDSLANIADAAANAKTNTQAVGDAVNQLAAFVPSGGGTVVSTGVQIGSIIAQSAIEARAAQSLSDAVGKADPALQAIADIIKKDLADLDKFQLEQSRRQKKGIVDQYGPRRTYWEGVRSRFDAATAANTGANEDAARKANELYALVAATDPDRLAYEKALAQVDQDREAFKQLIAASIEAVDRWAAAHRGLQKSIADNRRPNVRLLLSRVQEIRDLIDRMHNKK